MGGLHGEGDPLTSLGVDDRTQWVIDRIVDLFPGADARFEPPIAVSTLEEARAALQGRAGYTLFGLSSMAIAVERHPEIVGLLEDALAAWRAWASEHGHDVFPQLDE